MSAWNYRVHNFVFRCTIYTHTLKYREIKFRLFLQGCEMWNMISHVKGARE
jgi:hypothetical protein